MELELLTSSIVIMRPGYKLPGFKLQNTKNEKMNLKDICSIAEPWNSTAEGNYNP